MGYFIDFSLYIFIKWCETLEMDWHLKQFNEITISHSRAHTRKQINSVLWTWKWTRTWSVMKLFDDFIKISADQEKSSFCPAFPKSIVSYFVDP